MKTTEHDDYTLTYDDSEDAKQKLFDRVLAFFHQHRSYSGECIGQRDLPQIEAPNLLGDIADEVFKFEQKWKEEA